MRTSMRGLAAGAGAAALLGVSAFAAPAAQAASHIVHAGRGGVFVITTPGPVSAATVAAGVTVSVAVMAAVALVGLRLDRGGGARLNAVPTPGEQSGERADAPAAQSDRKAA
jgi:hypothetical protein